MYIEICLAQIPSSSIHAMTQSFNQRQIHINIKLPKTKTVESEIEKVSPFRIRGIKIEEPFVPAQPGVHALIHYQFPNSQ